MSSSEATSGQEAVIGWVFDAIRDMRDSTNHEWTKSACDRILENMPTGEDMAARLQSIMTRHSNYQTTLSNARRTLEAVQIFGESLAYRNPEEDWEQISEQVSSTLKRVQDSEKDAYQGNREDGLHEQR